MGIFKKKEAPVVKELYIRRGNSEQTENVIIIGEEMYLGERDISGYRPSKGAVFTPINDSDPYSGTEGLTYIHATPNILLDSDKYKRDYDVHTFVKTYCKDLVKWDGETNEGLVRSREAFIIKGDINEVIDELYKRIETEIHGGIPTGKILAKKIFRAIFVPENKKKSNKKKKIHRC